jgi:hypothetical protein
MPARLPLAERGDNGEKLVVDEDVHDHGAASDSRGGRAG